MPADVFCFPLIRLFIVCGANFVKMKRCVFPTLHSHSRIFLYADSIHITEAQSVFIYFTLSTFSISLCFFKKLFITLIGFFRILFHARSVEISVA